MNHRSTSEMQRQVTVTGIVQSCGYVDHVIAEADGRRIVGCVQINPIFWSHPRTRQISHGRKKNKSHNITPIPVLDCHQDKQDKSMMHSVRWYLLLLYILILYLLYTLRVIIIFFVEFVSCLATFSRLPRFLQAVFSIVMRLSSSKNAAAVCENSIVTIDEPCAAVT
ncbi:hypothetical protein TNCV_3556111 [Trichonephila clavipes]|nr:hypothetical protein TNCV_3556111 [Trichonephila clavipes]